MANHATATIEDVKDAKNYAFNLQQRIMDQATREERMPTASELANIDRANQEAIAVERRVGAARSDRSFMEAIDRTGATGMVRSTRDPRAVRGNSLGAQFARSEVGDWLEKNPVRGTKWETPLAAFDDPRFGGERHATTLTTTQGGSGGALVVPQYLPDIVSIPLRRPVVRDLLGAASVLSNLIIYNQETTFTNAAAAVAEGAAKPEGAISFAQVSEPVGKLAWWLPVTEELLADLPAMANYIDERLVAGLQVTEDDQLLNGNGVAPNLTGLLTRTGLAPDVPRGTDTNVDAIAKQIAAIETANPGIVATGIIMHPTNYLSARLMKSTLGTYIGGDPFAPPLTPTLWGLPIALTVAIPLGTALVVCRSQAMVFTRSGILMSASNSHQDFFIKNLVAIRCEERIALAVFRPTCFGRVTGLN